MSVNGEYISREAAIEAVCKCCLANGNCGHTCKEVTALQSIPAADVRPVVTCGECIHGKGEKMDFWNEYKGIECIGGVVHRKDWFCADGAKREES